MELTWDGLGQVWSFRRYFNTQILYLIKKATYVYGLILWQYENIQISKISRLTSRNWSMKFEVFQCITGFSKLSCFRNMYKKLKSVSFIMNVQPEFLISNKTLVWSQWWSFADVSQQGLNSSKKISKRKIIFWFDFHRCLHGSSKSA